MAFNWFISNLQNHLQQWYLFCRCQLLSVTESSNDFINNLTCSLFEAWYCTNSRSLFSKNLAEFLLTEEFSDNYTFHVQYGIQEDDWSNDLSTLYVYVIYTKQNNVIENINFNVLSEYENHDTTGVHLYDSKIITFLKTQFVAKNVKKIYYSSDGAGSDYTYKYNFLNLLHHKNLLYICF